jgi:hypothetical protein
LYTEQLVNAITAAPRRSPEILIFMAQLLMG